MLTGNTRYRISFNKKLILQVEYRCGLDDNDPREMGMTTRYRDATYEDVQSDVLNKMDEILKKLDKNK